MDLSTISLFHICLSMIRPDLNPDNEPAALTNLTYPELVEMIDLICEVDTEDEVVDYYAQTIELTLPGAQILDLFYWPDEWFQDPAQKEIDLDSHDMAKYILAWTKATLHGAENLTLPEIPATKKD